MHYDQTIIGEMRTMLLDGATPSRIVRHVLERTSAEGSPRCRAIVQGYFGEAFNILLRGLPADPAQITSAFSNPYMNQHPLHRIIQWGADWVPQSQDGSWIDDLEANDPGELNDSVDLNRETELAGVIDDLDDPARTAIKRWIGNINYLYELVQILAALAERLQQKIDGLEEQLGNETETVGAGQASLD
jgi:hypothetical protein